MKTSNILEFPKPKTKCEILSDNSVHISNGFASLTFHADGSIELKGKNIRIEGDEIKFNGEKIDLC